MNFRKILLLFLLLPAIAAPNRVFVVISSDTSIWYNTQGGNDKYTFQNEFDPDVFTNPEGVYRDVFEESFRLSHTDSKGRPFKVSWFMHGGGWFLEGTNTTAASTTFFIKKYWQSQLEKWGDEIAYHFHHFVWEGDQWSMAPTFGETIWDFEWTMSEMIINEGVYPVSFRSGWNYMDNEYQNYLEKWIPFRMEGAGWMPDCSPYHPSFTNYRKPGEMKGWEVRHYYMKSFTESAAKSIFNTAGLGKAQVVCIWSHQNETDFIQQIADVDRNLKTAEAAFPWVSFEYCTGREAMNRYMAYPGTGGTLSSTLLTTETVVADNDDGPPVYMEQGTWTTSPSAGYNGGSYRFAWAGDPSRADWSVTLPGKGYYDVSTAFLQSPNRADASLFVVHASDGDYPIPVSQNGIQEIVERPIGTFHFDGPASVSLDASASSPTSAAVISDAILFAWSPVQEPTPTPTPSPTPTPTPTPFVTPEPTPTMPPPLLALETDVQGDRVNVTVESDPDIYPLQPWVAAREYTDRYIRMDTVKTSPTIWRFSYDRKDIDRAVVGVCDIYGNVSLEEVKDGSYRISTQSEFYHASPRNLDVETSPLQTVLDPALTPRPVLGQTLSGQETNLITRSYWIGQTFLPGAPDISHVEFGVDLTEPSEFLVELRTILADGFPDDNPTGLLASATASASSSGMIDAPLSFDGLVMDGRPYALVFKILSGKAEIRLDKEDPYSDGLLIRAFSLEWITIPEFDCQFRIYDGDGKVSLEQDIYNAAAYSSERGYFISETLVLPGEKIAGIELDILDAPGNMIGVQLRKILPGGFPDFSSRAIIKSRNCPVSSSGKTYLPLDWNLPPEMKGELAAFTFVCPSDLKESVKLGYAAGNPYDQGEMFVSDDLASIEKKADQDLYFRVFEPTYPTSGSLALFHDAGTGAIWTGAEIGGDLPEGTSFKTRYRFADSKAELEAAPWTDYYDSVDVVFDPRPEARFAGVDIRLFTDGRDTPVLKSFEIFYEPGKLELPEGSGAVFY